MTNQTTIQTTSAVLASAMVEGWTIDNWNDGCYAGTTTPIRPLSGMETVTVDVARTGGRIRGCDSWIIDRFGSLNSRQAKRLLLALGLEWSK